MLLKLFSRSLIVPLIRRCAFSKIIIFLLLTLIAVGHCLIFDSWSPWTCSISPRNTFWFLFLFGIDFIWKPSQRRVLFIHRFLTDSPGGFDICFLLEISCPLCLWRLIHSRSLLMFLDLPDPLQASGSSFRCVLWTSFLVHSFFDVRPILLHLLLKKLYWLKNLIAFMNIHLVPYL